MCNLLILTVAISCLLAPNEPAFIFHRAESFLQAGEITTAITIYQIAIQKIRKHIPESRVSILYLEWRVASIHYLYGQVLLDQKRHHEALDNLKIAFEYGWRTDFVQLRIAMVYIGLKDLDVALQLLCDLLIRSPKNISLIGIFFIPRVKRLKFSAHEYTY